MTKQERATLHKALACINTGDIDMARDIIKGLAETKSTRKGRVNARSKGSAVDYMAWEQRILARLDRPDDVFIDDRWGQKKETSVHERLNKTLEFVRGQRA